MTDKQPEALRMAALLEKTGAQGSLRDEAASELRLLHAENESLLTERERNLDSIRVNNEIINKKNAELETLRAKLKTYEDLGDAGSDVQLLRMGYAAARLEIESLNAQLHAAKQINAAQFRLLAASIPGSALRASHGQAPAQAAPAAMAGPDDYTPLLDDEGRMMVGTSHHYTAENIRALVAEYKALEAGGPDTWELHYNTDHRARAGVLWRVISALADEVPFAAALATQPAPQQEVQEPSPTAGMSIAQRILHVGGRNNAAGYVEFGSTQAVEALVKHVLRDLHPSPAAQGDALPREDFAWLVVQEACETEPADEDDPECVRILRRDLKSSVLAAFLRLDAARAAQEGKSHGH